MRDASERSLALLVLLLVAILATIIVRHVQRMLPTVLGEELAASRGQLVAFVRREIASLGWILPRR